MAINFGKPLRLNYDEEADVLYASIDKPQPAVSVEIEPDMLLRYVPPSNAIVGITMIYFQEHFPCPPQKNLYEHAASVVIDLLTKYRVVPEGPSPNHRFAASPIVCPAQPLFVPAARAAMLLDSWVRDQRVH